MAWPVEAKVMALVGQGFTRDEALSTTPAEYRRLMAVARAWAIPPDRRVGNQMATAEDAPLA